MYTQWLHRESFYSYFTNKQKNIKTKKPQQHGPKPIKRSLGSKPSSLWEVDTRHGSVAQKYSLPSKGFDIHAGMCGGKKERGCSSNLPSFLHFPLPLPPSPESENSPFISFAPQCNAESVKTDPTPTHTCTYTQKNITVTLNVVTQALFKVPRFSLAE